MRKILLIFVISALVFVIYGCKPALSDELYSFVEYVERLKLRGQTNNFFVEMIIGERLNEDFCKLVIIPINLYSDAENLSFAYGKHSGTFEKDLFTGHYFAIINNYDKAHSYVTLRNANGEEQVPLIALTEELPAKKLLLAAYTHFEDILYKEFKSKEIRHKTYIKILADMSGNAFFYVGFIGDKDFLAVLFDVDTYEIIAEYVR